MVIGGLRDRSEATLPQVEVSCFFFLKLLLKMFRVEFLEVLLKALLFHFVHFGDLFFHFLVDFSKLALLVG